VPLFFLILPSRPLRVHFLFQIFTFTDTRSSCIIPETKGRSLEDIHIIFGSTTQEARTAHIAARETELDHEFHGDTHHDDEKVHIKQTV
jgi:hypothetical protein